MESEVSEVEDRTSGPAAKPKLSATMTATSPRPEKQRLRKRKLRTEPQGVWIFRGLGKEGKNQSREKTSGRVTSWKQRRVFRGGRGGRHTEQRRRE